MARRLAPERILPPLTHWLQRVVTLQEMASVENPVSPIDPERDGTTAQNVRPMLELERRSDQERIRSDLISDRIAQFAGTVWSSRYWMRTDDVGSAGGSPLVVRPRVNPDEWRGEPQRRGQ